MRVNIAAAQYDISFLESWQTYGEKISRWVAEAADKGANILVFPEYHALELASLFGQAVYSSLEKQLAAMQTVRADFMDLYQSLAKQHHCLIQAGSFPVRLKSGAYHNRAYLFHPDGRVDYQDKLMMTRFENEQWLIRSGDSLKCFATEYGKIAITICYDSEFPLLARRQVAAGAELILVPSCTDTLAGYHRVKIGCQARALENQCYVAQACLVGDAPWSQAVDINTGVAAVYTPVDRGFPDNGILACGEWDKVQWVYATLSLAAISDVRSQGQVFNYRDWPLQDRFHLEAPGILPLP